MTIPFLSRAPWGVPWFIFDLGNKQLITSPTVPGDIRDTKNVILTETPIPGLDYQPVVPVGGGNRRISLTLPLMRKNSIQGNILMLKQFDLLRHQAKGRGQWRVRRFAPNPKVLYYWGTGSVPLVWWVSKCDATHKANWYTRFGMPMYSEIEIELILDAEHPLNRAEEMFRDLAPISGALQQLGSGIEGMIRTNQSRVRGRGG